MERVYQEAFREVDEIFKIMPIDLLSKIPARLRKVITDNKALDYNVKIQEPIMEKNLKKETVIILGLVYRDFISSPEERKQLQFKDEQELNKPEEMQEQEKIESILNNGELNTTNEQAQEYGTDLIVYKEPGIIKRFFGFIKRLFGREKI